MTWPGTTGRDNPSGISKLPQEPHFVLRTCADAELWLTAAQQWYKEHNKFSYSGLIRGHD